MKHFVFLLLLALSVPVMAQSKSAPSSNSAIAQSWIDAWNSHDPDKLAALFTEDALYEDVAFASVNHGLAELKKFAASEFSASPDLKVELVNSSIGSEHGTIEWVFSGTDAGMFKTGKKFSVRGVSVITLSNGKISRNIDYYDAASLMRQLGILPTTTN